MPIKDLYPEKYITACHGLFALITPNPAMAKRLSALFDDKLAQPASDYYNEDLDILWVAMEASDWSWGYYVDWADPEGFSEQVGQLAAAWGLSAFVPPRFENSEPDELVSVAACMADASEALEGYGLVLWHWDTLEDNYCGWITRLADADAVTAIADTLGATIQPANRPYEDEIEVT